MVRACSETQLFESGRRVCGAVEIAEPMDKAITCQLVQCNAAAVDRRESLCIPMEQAYQLLKRESRRSFRDEMPRSLSTPSLDPQ